ncbi:hypothetical protein HAZT_HAZT008713 [Hyalella azteca]|uniref:Acyltransferase C-terminal domain-containing protein n=1 Tax=Hyalella azteca TaxID=294128 RepID=A0A6A0GWF7_HYAAZ|nr:hypothetical protein HAZT_HAZT008713 [Hyalella azteca]
MINAVQFILYFTIRPFNKSLYRNINYYLMYSIMAQILFLAEWWSGSEVRVYTDPEDRKLWGREHSLIIMNHTYEVDWLMGWMVADRCGVLGMLLFAEGTRFTQQKHQASMEFARERGLQQLKRHLIPRTRGFIQCAQSLQGHFPVIYDVTVGFNTKEGAEPTVLNMLQGRRVVGEMYIRRLPLRDVPVGDDQKTSQYLHNLYQTKDRLLDSYCNTGSFTSQNDMPKFVVVMIR